MHLLYKVVIRLYFCAIYFASFFNTKAKLWIEGRKVKIQPLNGHSIWFHFASLGEFEQGRPVLEQIKTAYIDCKIIITFFSPSGFEVRKNTPLADAVYYLPLDTAKNAREFMDAIKPKFAVFTKYEYWYCSFKEVNKREIPIYLISGIFREGQIFFKWYGALNRQILTYVNWFFVQDTNSATLLNSLGIDKASVSGDTRFDRVWENAQSPKTIAAVAEFKNKQKVFIAGSTWPPDEKLIATLPKSYTDWKFIIAPHEVAEEKINNLETLFANFKTIRFSQMEKLQAPIADFQVLIIDNIGMLSALYQYGDIAYIGGGFGVGIHNTLEAAAFGLPVIFGPNYAKFNEARQLINLQAAFSINNDEELLNITEKLVNEHGFYRETCIKARNYVKENIGATRMIVEKIKSQNPIKNN